MGEMDEGADRAVKLISGQGPASAVKTTMFCLNN